MFWTFDEQRVDIRDILVITKVFTQHQGLFSFLECPTSRYAVGLREHSGTAGPN